MGGLVGSRDIVNRDLVWVKHCCIGQSKSISPLLFSVDSRMLGDERRVKRMWETKDE
jgi:hypothetical protein